MTRFRPSRHRRSSATDHPRLRPFRRRHLAPVLDMTETGVSLRSPQTDAGSPHALQPRNRIADLEQAVTELQNAIHDLQEATASVRVMLADIEAASLEYLNSLASASRTARNRISGRKLRYAANRRIRKRRFPVRGKEPTS